MLLETKLFANKMDLEPYYLYRQKNILGNFENIGYAKKGYECIYNISIMEERESIMAAGVGSTSKAYFPEENRLERIFNFRDLYEYINRIDELIERKRKILYSI
jgi:oxygen-independent coproporphyrinogen-3 oxidase